MKEEQQAFHLSNLPYDLIYIAFNPDFASEFFMKLLSHLSVDRVADIAEVTLVTIKKWIASCRNSENPPFLRLDKLQRLIEKIEECENWSIPVSELEKNVIGLKGYGRSGILWSPKLPFREDANLVRVIVHMIGDGFIPKEKGSTKVPMYSNSNDFLRSQFSKCLSQILGDVSGCTREYVDKTRHARSYVALTQWLGYIFRYWYPDAEFDELKGALPARFFELPLELKAEMVRTFGDDDGHVGAHSIRFTSGGETILKQMRRLVIELMEATLPPQEFEELSKSVGLVKPCKNWFILNVYRPLYRWYSENVGFSHPERAERLEFQLECDVVHEERGLDGFDLDFLVLVGLGEPGSVGSLARRFTLREDFLFPVVQRLRKLGWLRRVEKRKFTTYYQTTLAGRRFLERVFSRGWDVGDRLVLSNEFVGRLCEELLGQFGSAAAVVRAAGVPETTVRGYLRGGRQWMSGRWVVALAGLVGWGVREVGDGVVVAFGSGLAPRYEQCDFLGKAMMSYRWFSSGKVGFEEWLGGRRREVVRVRRLLDAGFAEKLKNSGVIRVHILALAEAKGGEVTLEGLRNDSVLGQLVTDRYGAYLADRMAKLVKQGVFARVRRGVYRLVGELGVG